jgi:two-component system sensor histidine kinase EvgS
MNNMKDSNMLLAGLSQEFRTQMNSIVGFSYLITQSISNNKENGEYSNQILNSCNRIMWLFESFLEAAILDSDSSDVNIKKCNLNDIIYKLQAEFEEILAEENSNSNIVVNEDNSYCLSDVYIDYAKVTKVIHTLFKNAVCNTKSGFIKLGHDIKDGKLTFYILDSSQAHSKYEEFINTVDFNKSLTIFDDPATAVNIMLARKIVNIMGGMIWSENSDANGTGVFFSIPVKMEVPSKYSFNNFFNEGNSIMKRSLVI